MRETLSFLRGIARLSFAWPVAAIILSAIGWHFLLSDLDADRQDFEKHALREVNVLANSYADELTRTIEAIDQITLHVRYDWELTKGDFRLEDAKAKGLFPPNSIFLVLITDDNGVVVSGTLPNSKNAFLGDREYFLVHRNTSRDFLHIGEPIVGRISQRNTIPFTRRLSKQDGSFGGVVSASVAPDYFTTSYNETTFGKNGFLGIIGYDNIVRVTRTGQTVHPSQAQALVSALQFQVESGSVFLKGNEWFSDKRSRYIGWDIVKGYPLIAIAGLEQQEVLAPYWANRAATIRDGMAATVALAVFTLIAMALSMRLAWRKHQLKVTQATYRMATEGGNEGFYIACPVRDEKGTIVDFEIIDCNQRGAEIFCHRREELIRKTISAVYESADPERLINMLRQAMEVGFYESELEVPSESPLTLRWAHLKIVRSGANLAVTLRDISDSKAHVAELERRSNEDTLTALPNRHWVQTYLPKAIALAAVNNVMLALLFIDLDGFKAVNDTLGHAAGDDVLRNAARRLKEAVRPHDRVARLGGDEFVVILDISHKADAAHVAERILHAFQDGFRLSQGVHSVGVSIGISIFPNDGADAKILLRNADIAMYSVKTTGKGNYRFYDERFYEALRARLEKEAELRHAIEHDEFVMYYQPRVDITTGVTSSLEALVRWNHPIKGLLSPLDFIPLAEETGLILSLGELVIHNVCAQLAYWSERGADLVPVSINVSPRQFNEVDIPQILATALERHHTSSALVEIEVTESSMMIDSTHISGVLTAIRKMGIKLLVDDFGTGYSSLSQLQKLDFDVLKVDRAFTAELGRTDKAKVFYKAIITMAHALDMRVVAEGVENETQVKILKSLQCDELQGYYISRPMPPGDTQAILVSSR
jgi:diguanylate cyclase (GGDEF)-like protein